MSVSLFGCGSQSSNSNLAVENANPPANVNVVPIVPPESNAIAANSANVTNANVVAVTPPVNIKPMVYPAPDNSEYTSAMDKTGAVTETRVFHHNPQLIKIVKVTRTVTDKSISIYLKNGKVVNLPGDKLQDIKSQPVSVILE